MKEIIKINPNIFEQTILKNQFAKEMYEYYLLQNINNYGVPRASSELKNILQINTAVGKGGAAKVAHGFLNVELNKRGLNSKILVGTDYLKIDETVTEIEQTNISLHKTLHKASRNMGWLDFFNPSCFNIPELEIFKNADVVHLHNLHGAYFSQFLLPNLTSLKPT